MPGTTLKTQNGGRRRKSSRRMRGGAELSEDVKNKIAEIKTALPDANKALADQLSTLLTKDSSSGVLTKDSSSGVGDWFANIFSGKSTEDINQMTNKTNEAKTTEENKLEENPKNNDMGTTGGRRRRRRKSRSSRR